MSRICLECRRRFNALGAVWVCPTCLTELASREMAQAKEGESKWIDVLGTLLAGLIVCAGFLGCVLFALYTFKLLLETIVGS